MTSTPILLLVLLAVTLTASPAPAQESRAAESATDPNDIVPHEHRRELRGLRVFAAWTNHVDTKAINSLDTLVTENGRAVVGVERLPDGARG